MPGIDIQHIRKTYDKVTALDDISFSVKEAELFGLIGPDGAGKSSLFRILTTAMLPDSGTATVAGYPLIDYKTIRKIVGYMPGRFSLYQDLSVEENLKFFATVFGTTIEANYDLIKSVYAQLAPFKDRRAGALSGGMKQKLALSCALIHQPKVLFLDEPTTGVDPVSRRDFWESLKELKSKGITIMVSTAYMDEAALCDRVALIQKGHILAIDTPQDIPRLFHKKLFALQGTDPYRLLQVMEQYSFRENVYLSGEALHYVDSRPDVTAEDITGYLAEQGFATAEVRPIQPGIEDCFIALMKEQEGSEQPSVNSHQSTVNRS